MHAWRFVPCMAVLRNIVADLPCKTGDVRLVGGPSQSVGIAEICFNGKWSIVCRDALDLYEATLICKQLGYLPVGKVVCETKAKLRRT